MNVLAELLDDLADEIGVTERRAVGGAVEYRRGGTLFAVSGPALELRLRPDVAAAALGTPGTTPSTRGEGWVGFAPSQVDQLALDRASAWFALAWRVAAG